MNTLSEHMLGRAIDCCVRSSQVEEPSAILGPGSKDGQTKCILENGAVIAYSWDTKTWQVTSDRACSYLQTHAWAESFSWQGDQDSSQPTKVALSKFGSMALFDSMALPHCLLVALATDWLIT